MIIEDESFIFRKHYEITCFRHINLKKHSYRSRRFALSKAN